jgi:nicotinate dehydrogenase subunit B
VTQLSVTKGVVSGGGKSVSYGDLIGGKLFNVRMPASYNLDNPSGPAYAGGLQAGQSPARPVSQYRVVGTSPARIDIPAIVSGTASYIQNIRIPRMQHGRVVRPRGQAVYGAGAPVVSIDQSSIAHIPNVKLVRVGDFLGVVAPYEYDAVQAAAQLKVKWADPPASLPGGGNEFAALRAADSAGKTQQSYRVLTGNVDNALRSATHAVAATYAWPTNVHTPIGPSCAIADVTSQGVRVFAGSQGAYGTRSAVARVLGLAESRVRVTACAMGGCFGPGMPYNDAAQAAALMSRAAGVPVRVQLMRWDEIGWTATAPGTLMDVRAGVDGGGKIVGFDFTQFYPQYINNTVLTSDELAGSPVTLPSSVSAVYPPTTMYEVPNNRWLLKSLPIKDNWVRCQWMRCGSTPHVTWAVEQTTDELARLSGMDPVAFRRQNVIQDANGANTQRSLLAVLDRVTQAAGWQPKVPASKLSDATVATGRGVAWSDIYATAGLTKSAGVADVEVNRKTGKITVKHVYMAFTAGLSVNPGLVENQLVGGITQILSRLFTEQLGFSKTRVTSGDFVTYPLLRFKDHPKVTPLVVQELDQPPSGVGEPVTLVAAAAVANAVFDATGVRLRTAPYTPARVRAALKAAGVA